MAWMHLPDKERCPAAISIPPLSGADPGQQHMANRPPLGSRGLFSFFSPVVHFFMFLISSSLFIIVVWK
jgi:hypothetical protein